MNQPVLLDAGPLVAMLNRREMYHAWSHDQAERLPSPLLSCEAAMAEACFLLSSQTEAVSDAMDLVARGQIVIPFRLEAESSAVEALMRKYSNVPMSLADACLVRMAELYPQSKVFTLDSDFRIYRKNGRQVIPTIVPK